MNQYDLNVQKMMELLNVRQFCYSSKTSHMACYQELREYLVQNELEYSSDNANQWLKMVKENNCRQEYSSWWKYIEQLKELISTGTVSDNHLFLNKSFYDKVPGVLKTEQLEEYRDRKIKYDAGRDLMVGRNSYSKTDHDATFMHMKDDHMQNAQLKPAYNVQIAVESEYVTGVGIFQDRNDIATLIPMLNEMKEKLGRTYTNVIADSGYESEKNYLYLEQKGQRPFIKPRLMKTGKREALKMT